MSVRLVLIRLFTSFETRSTLYKIQARISTPTYYYTQGGALRANGVNALVHYVRNGPTDTAYVPNPLFGNGYYLATNSDVRAGGLNPFGHYLVRGCREGRHPSHVLQRMIEDLRRSARSPLLRDNWKDESVLIIARGGADDAHGLRLARTAALLADEHHLEAMAVFVRRAGGYDAGQANILMVEDYATATDVFRPSALRLLAKALTARPPLFALADVPDVLATLGENGVPTYFVASDDDDTATLMEATRCARRLLFASSRAFENAGQRLGVYPTAVALRMPESPHDDGKDVSRYVRSVISLAQRDFGLATTARSASNRSRRSSFPVPTGWSAA